MRKEKPVKIAVPSENSGGLNSKVCKHFGICPVFTIIELMNDNILSVSIIKNTHTGCGNCLELIEFLACEKISYVVADKIGLYPLKLLNRHAISTVHLDSTHNVLKAIELFVRQKLKDYPSDLVCNGECEC